MARSYASFEEWVLDVAYSNGGTDLVRRVARRVGLGPAIVDEAEPTLLALRGRRRPIKVGTAALLLVGLVVTASLSLGAQALQDSNDKRLLLQRVHKAAAVVSTAVASMESPLVSAAVLAEETNANPALFRHAMMPLMTTGGPFISASLWSLAGAQPLPLVVIGAAPELPIVSPRAADGLLRTALGRRTITVIDLLASQDRRFGCAYAVAASPNYVVYAEAAVPKNNQRVGGQRAVGDPAFADLEYALYLGLSPLPEKLVGSSSDGALLEGQRVSEAVPFGNSHLLLVITTKKELAGRFFVRLPWELAVVGLVITLVSGFLVERLLRRRDHAEALTHMVAGRFELLNVIGSGAFGLVWRAYDWKHRRLVAVKIFSSQGSEPELVHRFVQEQGFRLSHPNVLAPLDFFSDSEQAALVMDLADGGSLEEIVTRGGPALSTAVAILEQLLKGTAYVHSQGIIHRDIKPANVLLDADECGLLRIRLSDFGHALPTDGPRLTARGNVVGTPGYIAPELYDQQDATPCSDLYAVGAVAYQLLTGKRPTAPLHTVAANSPDLPESLRAWLVSLTQPEPGQRPATAEAALTGLREASSDLNVVAPAVTERLQPASRQRHPRRRRLPRNSPPAP